MSYSAEDLQAIAKKIRYDLTAAQAKLTDLMNGVADLAATLPKQGAIHSCPQCGLDFNATDTGRQKLADHMVNVHAVRDLEQDIERSERVSAA